MPFSLKDASWNFHTLLFLIVVKDKIYHLKHTCFVFSHILLVELSVHIARSRCKGAWEIGMAVYSVKIGDSVTRGKREENGS